MQLQTLTLRHFRNFETVHLEFAPGQNLILGDNGQGKTNLLEAIHLLAFARSHRTAQDRELIRHGATGASVTGTLLGASGLPKKLDALISVENDRLRTQFKVNGLAVKSRSQVLGHLPTVGFFLSDLQLLRGRGEDRRRWLDWATTQWEPRHLQWVAEFQRIRQQKAELLKSERVRPDHLAVWNEQFALAASRVITSRLNYLQVVAPLAEQHYQAISQAAEPLTMAYQSTAPGPDCLAALQSVLEARQTEEIRRGQCLVGPHRDDVVFSLSGHRADAYASQGQQRTVVLALKLAELDLLTKVERPLLLLDDVMAELDPDRQRFLLQHIHNDGLQVFLTTTHLEPGQIGQHVYSVKGGWVTPAMVAA
jgi:DNA replication and repair protein RecF